MTTRAGFTNPVIPGFHPDPSVCRVGDTFVLATSSFTYFPGVPIFRSQNLVDWTQVGNALGGPSQLDLSATTGSSSYGICAPTLRHHGGRFWMITTVFSRSDSGRVRTDNFFVTAADAEGPWSEPVRVAIRGIDPDLAWDAEGICWVHYSGWQRIERCRIDPDSGEVLEGPDVTWSGTGLQYPEAPHLFEREGTWYLLIAEGGTERGHAVSIARGPSPTGPWEGCPANPVLRHSGLLNPIQNTGHADLVEAADGSWWMVLLATRPRGETPGYHVLGRETFLAPVKWVDGWPVVGPLELGRTGPVPAIERDDFDEPVLHPRWLAVRQPPAAVSSLSERPGWLTLVGGEGLNSPSPAFIGRRQQHERCRVRALVEAGDAAEAGLTVRMDERHHYDVAIVGDRVVATSAVGPVVAAVRDAPARSSLVLVIEMREPTTGGPDDVVLGYEDDRGSFIELATLDGRYLSTEVASGMLGRVIGMYAVGGSATFDWFEYSAV